MTTKRQITPFITIETEAFAKHYQQGVWWSMYGDEQGQGLVRDSYLVTNVQSCIERGYFDGHHAHWFPSLGFYLGRYHGGVLSPSTGQQRPDATTLVAFSHQDATEGYYIGREWYFTEAQTHERRYTESKFIERLQDLVLESSHQKEADAVWYYTIGCLLGELSGELFPLTEQDRYMWADISRQHEEAYQHWKASQERTTEPLSIVTLQEA